MFLFKKIRASTFSGLRQLLSFVTVRPAVEKSLSLGVEVAGIQSKDAATLASSGYWDLFCFHQSNGCVSRGTAFSAKNCANWASQPVSDAASSWPRRMSSAVYFFFGGEGFTDSSVPCVGTSIAEARLNISAFTSLLSSSLNKNFSCRNLGSRAVARMETCLASKSSKFHLATS